MNLIQVSKLNRSIRRPGLPYGRIVERYMPGVGTVLAFKTESGESLSLPIEAIQAEDWEVETTPLSGFGYVILNEFNNPVDFRKDSELVAKEAAKISGCSYRRIKWTEVQE